MNADRRCEEPTSFGAVERAFGERTPFRHKVIQRCALEIASEERGPGQPPAAQVGVGQILLLDDVVLAGLGEEIVEPIGHGAVSSQSTIADSVREVAGAGEVHRHARGLRGLDDSVVPDRATRLHDGANARLSKDLQPVREGEEGIGGGI